MSDTNPISTNQWLHYYQETAAGPTVVSCGIEEDGTTMMTGFPGLDNASSLENSSTTTSTIGPGGGNSSTSPLGSPLKPIRRRSRASKRTPVTLLNASATNFRALVQQFTGCPHETAAASATQFRRQKGPVNLNFERNDRQMTDTSSRYGYHNQQQIRTPILPQQTQGTFSLGSSISDPTSRTNIQSGLDNFVMENVSLQNEFIDESSINGTSSNGGYFF